MKVLIIGGTGKIGHRLAQDLSTTHQVIVAGLNSGQHKNVTTLVSYHYTGYL